jgi:hypothetical protein
MLKPLTFSLSLALALGLCSVSMAGGHDDNCTTCGLASPQGGVYATGQGAAAGCDTAPCAPKKKHCFSFHMPKIKCNFPKLVHTCSYEWVLKKKHCFSLQHAPKCGNNGCDPVYATGQGGIAPSGQGAAAPSGQYGGAYGAGLDRRGACRDDPGNRSWRGSSSRPRSLDDPRPALADPGWQLS